MKKVFFALLIILTISCKENYKTFKYEIKGNTNKKEGKIYLINFDETKIIDSTNILDGKFFLKGVINSPDYYYLNMKDSPYMNGFYVEGGKQIINIRDTKGSYIFNVSGGDITKTWSNYVKIFKSRESLIHELREKIHSEENNEIYIRKFDSLDREMQYEIDSYINENKNSITAAYAILFNKTELSTLKNKYDLLTNNIKNSVVGKRISKKITELGLMKKVGDTLPNYEVVDLNNKKVKLANYISGKQITLIDFWASWCGPCRKQHPSMIHLFNENKKHDFNIIGISTDTKASDWKKAIKKDKLPWVQLIDSKKNVIKDLRIKSIPYNFIIDSKRKIIAVDVDIIDLQEKIDSIISSNQR